MRRILWWSIFTAVTAIAGELFLTSLIGIIGSFAVVRVLIGLGEAAAPPNGNRVIANWAAPHERGLALGIAVSGSSLGAALTPPLIVWIMLAWGWRAAFYIAGGVGIGIAFLWYMLARDQPADHPWVNEAERQYVSQGETTAQEPSPPLHLIPWRALLSRPDLWLLTGAYFVLGYTLYFYFSWFFLYLVNERGFSMQSGGFYTMAPFLASAVFAPIGGWLSDTLSAQFGKRIGRCAIGFTSLILTGVFVSAGATTTSAYTAILFLSLGAGSLFISASVYWVTTIDLAKKYAGTVSGFMNMGGNIGGAISPTLTPYLAQAYGWETALYTMAGLACVAAFCWLGVHPEQEIDLAEDAGEKGEIEYAN